MTKNQVARMIAVRYQFSYYFVELLQRLLAKMPAGACRQAVQENLEEEMGISSHYPSQPHWQQRQKLLGVLGASNYLPKGGIDELDETLHPAAAKVVTKFKQLVDCPNWLTGYGTVAMSELQAAKHFQMMLLKLEQAWPELEALDKEHLVDHAGHDSDHASELFRAFKTLNLDDQRTAFVTGMLPAYQYWLEFWSDLKVRS